MEKYWNTVTYRSGTRIEGATIEVLDSGGALTEIFSDENGSSSLGTSTTTDENGFYQFYVADGTYSIRHTFNGVSETITGIEIYDRSQMRADIDAADSDKATAAALGVAADAEDMGTFTGSTISDNATAKVALQDIETSHEAAVTTIGVSLGDTDMGTYTGATIPDNETAKQNLQSLETAVETKANASALGVTSSAADMGTFTGSTISDNQTAKQALQALETAVETKTTAATLAASGGSALVGFLQSGGSAVARTVQSKLRAFVSANDFGFSTSASAADNNTYLQAAIDYAKTQTETILADKYVITTADVYIESGEYDLSGAVELYTGVRLIGSGQSTTLIKHAGGATHCFVYTAAGTEYLYNVWVMDLAIKGGGKTSSDTLSAIKSDDATDGHAVYGCGVTRCLITNCYDGVNLQNSWTFEVSDCEFYDVGRNFIRGLNLTAAKIKGNRMDTAGEDGVFATFSTTASLETVSLLLSQNVIQSCQRRGIYGFDCDHFMWDENYVENCNQAGGYPHVEFESDSGTNAEMYSFVGGWASPGSNSGQPAFKIDKARFVSSHGVYIRGNNFSLGWELGADVEGYSIDGEFNGGTFISVSGNTTGISLNRLGLTVHGVDSETQTASATSSNANSSLSERIKEINCTSGNRTYTLLDAHLQRGRRFTVQKSDGGSNQLIIAREGTTEINGAAASVNSTTAFARAEIFCGVVAGTSTLCWYVKFT